MSVTLKDLKPGSIVFIAGFDDIPDDRARYSRERVGSDYIGWLHIQTVWNKLIIDQPDMFD